MNINRKYIIIFGTLVLLVIIIVGITSYLNERAKQAQVPDTGQSVLSSSHDNPASSKGLLNFMNECKNAVLFSDVEGLKNKEIKEIVCTLEQETGMVVLEDQVVLVSDLMPSFSSLDSIISFKPGHYIGISVDLKDVVRKYDSSLLEKDKLSFCSISEPSWEDKLYLQIAPEQNLFFPEGNVCCAGIKMKGSHTMYFSGFIPQAESLNIKQYLVDEQTVFDVMNKESFSEIKEILSNYSLIWQMEKPINL